MTAPRHALTVLCDEVTDCRRCKRLVRWREEVAREKRRAYAHETYWGRGVPSFGDPRAKVVLVGLAPGAHGANRTGRMFTGDASGDFLYPALHRAGLASQPRSTSRDDGLVLSNLWITAAARCAPPDNHPTPAELKRCTPFLDRELAALTEARVVLCLGAISWSATLGVMQRGGAAVPRPKPSFGHGAEVALGRLTLLASYHVSRHNTQTGRLTAAMFDAVIARALALSTAP